MDVIYMNMLDQAGVVFTEKKPTLTVQQYVVTEAMSQIHGMLHGGISAAIAEQGASLGASLALGETKAALGLSMDTHHLKGVKMGEKCEARAWPERQGGNVQVWRVEQRNVANDELFNISTVTIYGKVIKHV